MPMALDQLQNSVVGGQSELGKVVHLIYIGLLYFQCGILHY